MRSSLRRVAVPTVALLSFSVFGAACSSSSNTTTDTTAGSSSGTTGGAAGPSVDYDGLKGTLQGSGSSFQAGYNEAVIEALADKAADLTVNYNPVGSGTGKQDLADQKTQFAGTDSLVADADKPKYKGGAYLYFPTVAAPITISFNVTGLDKLQLSPSTAAKIFQGDIKKWDDAAIKTDNPSASLPSTDIKVVHRAESSGTTETFTKYLKKASPDWKLEASSTVTWPAEFVAAQGNGGVASAIKGADGSVGYVDFNDAKTAGLKFASVKNKAGTYIEPTLDATSAALATATVKPDLTYDALDATGPQAYPIAAATYILVYQKYASAEVATALKGLLTFILTDGQGLAAKANFAKLPDDLRQKAIAQLTQVTS